MGGIRLGIGAAVIEAVRPVLGRVLSESIDVRNLVWIELGPQSTLSAKVRDPALHRDAGASERHTDTGPLEQRGRHQLVMRAGSHPRPSKTPASGPARATELHTHSKATNDQTLSHTPY